MTNEKLREQIRAQEETIAKLQQQLKQQQLVISTIQEKSRIWLLPWTMSPDEVQKFAENNRRTFGKHCLVIPVSCVNKPQLMEIGKADEDQVKEWIDNADKCLKAMLANARQKAVAQQQARAIQKMMANASIAAPIKNFAGAQEVPAMKIGDNVFSLPTFDKNKRRFKLPDGSSPGGN